MAVLAMKRITICGLKADSKPILESYNAAAVFVTTDGEISTFGDLDFTKAIISRTSSLMQWQCISSSSGLFLSILVIFVCIVQYCA